MLLTISSNKARLTNFSPFYSPLSADTGMVLSSLNEGLSFLDGLFLAVSAMTSTGLATVSMVTLSPVSFVVLALMIVLGGSLVLPLAPLLYRRHVYRQLKHRYPRELSINNSPVLSEFDLLDRSLGDGVPRVYTVALVWP